MIFRKQSALILLSCSLLLLALAPLPALPAPSPGESAAGQSSPVSAGLFIAPFLLAGSHCSFAVLDSNGTPLPSAAVYIGDELYTADARGIILFRVPNSDSFEISLSGEGQKRFGKRRYTRFLKDIFAENEKTAAMADSLLGNSSQDATPMLIYSPSAAALDQALFLVGSNFSPNIADEFVEIDGNRAQLVCASPRCAVALLPPGLKPGPCREIFVSVEGQNSNSAELDLLEPSFGFTRAESGDDESVPEAGKIGVYGTNLPVLLRVRNLEAQSCSLWSPRQESLASDNILLTPGGEKNFLDISVRRLRTSAQPDIKLSFEGLFPPSPGLIKAGSLWNAACRADITRLTRLKNAAEISLEEVRSGQKPQQINDSADAAARRIALSLRVLRFSEMLAARRSLFLAFGNNPDKYAQILDDAAAGAMLSLDSSIKPVQIISDGGVGSASAVSDGEKTIRKGRPLRLLEPVIRLLPPMNEAQLAVMAELQKSRISADLNSAAEASEPKLRPGLPEQAAGISTSPPLRKSPPTSMKSEMQSSRRFKLAGQAPKTRSDSAVRTTRKKSRKRN